MVVFVGGSPGQDFAETIARGARQAAEDLDVDLRLEWSDWDNERMLVQFKQAVAERPDGIAIMGHPGESALAPLVAEARRKGVLVTSLNVDLPAIQQRYGAEGFGYVGQRMARSGHSLAVACIRMFELKPGDRVLLTGVKQYPIRGERTSSAEDALVEAGVTVDYLQDDGDLKALEAAVVAHLRGHPEIVTVVDDADAAFMGGVLKRNNFDPDCYRVAGFDLSPDALALLRNGYLDLIADQQPWLQGYLAVWQLAMSHRFGFTGLGVDTGSGFIHSGNLAQVERLVAEGVR
ncbi:MAG: substrate-binding domain-containing protein [Planctomycetota bacterium]|nr:substrate-binding domain-containing protein [Planctomycetota bacterium]